MNKKYILSAMIALATVLGTIPARAHDTWVQTNTNLVRVGDAVHIDLMLGNHGNEHRDFRIASKVDLAPSSLRVVAPDGKGYDLKDRLVDTGYAPKEGFWKTIFVAAQPGIYTVGHTYDSVVSYAPERSIKSAKAFFVASRSLDNPPIGNPGYDRPLGHPLEIVPVVNPVTPMGPGSPLTVRLLFQGKPLPGARIACIPQGATLKSGGIDERYEHLTDASGEATFEPNEAGYCLLVAHRDEETAGTHEGKPYSTIRYGATMTVFVPQVCPCCGE